MVITVNMNIMKYSLIQNDLLKDKITSSEKNSSSYDTEFLLQTILNLAYKQASSSITNPESQRT